MLQRGSSVEPIPQMMARPGRRGSPQPMQRGVPCAIGARSPTIELPAVNNLFVLHLRLVSSCPPRGLGRRPDASEGSDVSAEPGGDLLIRRCGVGDATRAGYERWVERASERYVRDDVGGFFHRMTR